jgi:hypothetical protein
MALWKEPFSLREGERREAHTLLALSLEFTPHFNYYSPGWLLLVVIISVKDLS